MVKWSVDEVQIEGHFLLSYVHLPVSGNGCRVEIVIEMTDDVQDLTRDVGVIAEESENPK